MWSVPSNAWPGPAAGLRWTSGVWAGRLSSWAEEHGGPVALGAGGVLEA